MKKLRDDGKSRKDEVELWSSKTKGRVVGEVLREWERPGTPLEEIRRRDPRRKEKQDAYNLWADLGSLKADVTFGQLLEISPITRETFKEELPVAKRKGRVKAEVVVRM